MDVNPLTHKFHLEAIEREALELAQRNDDAAPECARKRRFSWTSITRRMALLFPTRRSAHTA